MGTEQCFIQFTTGREPRESRLSAITVYRSACRIANQTVDAAAILAVSLLAHGSRTAWVVSIVPWRRTPWVVAQMWRGEVNEHRNRI